MIKGGYQITLDDIVVQDLWSNEHHTCIKCRHMLSIVTILT